MLNARIKTILFAVLFALSGMFISLAFLYGQSVRAASNVFFVTQDGNCNGQAPCYSIIQEALDAAAPGDEIQIATGIYTDTFTRPRMDTSTTGVVTQCIYLSKTVNISGGYNADFSLRDPDAYPTTVDAQGNGRGIYITGDISPTIEGLRITGGDPTGMHGYDYFGDYDAGGAVYIITATANLKDNLIFNNSAPYGAGVFLYNAYSTLDHNTVTTNAAGSAGGGIVAYKGTPILHANDILSNTVSNVGGGVYLFATDAILSNNTIADNSANTLGGGLDVASCNPTFNGNIFSGNFSHRGGGIYLWYSHSHFTNTVILNNTASIMGSGLLVGGSSPVMLHTTIAGNSGGDEAGVYVSDAGSGSNSTLAMTNTILSGHSIAISVTNGSAVDLNAVLWYSNPVTISQAGGLINIQNQYDGDPAFQSDGYHLTSASAAIDKGIDVGVTADIDGDLRPAGLYPDLGADEWWYPVLLPIILRN